MDSSPKISNERENELYWPGMFTHEQFVIVTESPQCNRKTAKGQDTENKIIIYKYTKQTLYKKAKNTTYNIQQLCKYRNDMCKFEM